MASSGWPSGPRWDSPSVLDSDLALVQASGSGTAPPTETASGPPMESGLVAQWGPLSVIGSGNPKRS